MSNDMPNQPGGPAANSDNKDPNQSTQDHQPAHAESDAVVTLKDAAAKFACAASSLKNNVNKLKAEQENPKAAYMVRLSVVESFLRQTPGIASVFHPKSPSTPGDDIPIASNREDHEQGPRKTEAALPADNSARSSVPIALPPEAQNVPRDCIPERVKVGPEQAPMDGKRRRNRRRGKGGTSSVAATGNQLPALKTLVGATPQERLRVIACLNELAGMIASA